MEIVKVIVKNDTGSITKKAELSLATGILKFEGGEYGHLISIQQKGFSVKDAPAEVAPLVGEVAEASPVRSARGRKRAPRG